MKRHKWEPEDRTPTPKPILRFNGNGANQE